MGDASSAWRWSNTCTFSTPANFRDVDPEWLLATLDKSGEPCFVVGDPIGPSAGAVSPDWPNLESVKLLIDGRCGSGAAIDHRPKWPTIPASVPIPGSRPLNPRMDPDDRSRGSLASAFAHRSRIASASAHRSGHHRVAGLPSRTVSPIALNASLSDRYPWLPSSGSSSPPRTDSSIAAVTGGPAQTLERITRRRRHSPAHFSSTAFPLINRSAHPIGPHRATTDPPSLVPRPLPQESCPRHGQRWPCVIPDGRRSRPHRKGFVVRRYACSRQWSSIGPIPSTSGSALRAGNSLEPLSSLSPPHLCHALRGPYLPRLRGGVENA